MVLLRAVLEWTVRSDIEAAFRLDQCLQHASLSRVIGFPTAESFRSPLLCEKSFPSSSLLTLITLISPLRSCKNPFITAAVRQSEISPCTAVLAPLFAEIVRQAMVRESLSPDETSNTEEGTCM